MEGVQAAREAGVALANAAAATSVNELGMNTNTDQ